MSRRKPGFWLFPHEKFAENALRNSASAKQSSALSAKKLFGSPPAETASAAKRSQRLFVVKVNAVHDHLVIQQDLIFFILRLNLRKTITEIPSQLKFR